MRRYLVPMTLAVSIVIGCVMLAIAQPSVTASVSCLAEQFAFVDDVVLASKSDGGLLYQLTDGGWRAISVPTGWDEVRVVSRDHYFVLVEEESAIYKTLDGGVSWRMAGHLPAVRASGADLYPSPIAGLLFLSVATPDTPGSGLWRSTDNGLTWQRVLGDEFYYPGATIFSPSFGSDGTIFTTLSGLRETYSVWKSIDFGATWLAINDGLPVTWYGIQEYVSLLPDYRHTQQAIIAVHTNSNSGLYETSDGGATWDLVYRGYFAYLPIVFSPYFEHDRVALVGSGTFDTVYLSSDRFATLRPIWHASYELYGISRPLASANPPPSEYELHAYLPFIAVPGTDYTLWVMTREDSVCHLFTSHDGGESWQIVNLP